jgi:hypothetical protein
MISSNILEEKNLFLLLFTYREIEISHAGLARRNAWARWGCPDANGQSWLGDHFGVRGPPQTDAAGRF